jgi:hypothetical protein
MAILGRFVSGLGQVVSLFVEEPRLTRQITVAESLAGFTVPDPTSPLPVSDRHIQDIDAPGIVADDRSVILFRTTHTGSPTFSVRVNATRVIQQTLSTPGPHTWHEVIPAGALLAADNELTFAVGTGEGSVTFSDVVIFYTANQLTIRFRRPPVATQG